MRRIKLIAFRGVCLLFKSRVVPVLSKISEMLKTISPTSKTRLASPRTGSSGRPEAACDVCERVRTDVCGSCGLVQVTDLVHGRGTAARVPNVHI